MSETSSAIIQQAVEAAGFEFVGIQDLGQDGARIVRVYIDSERGITLDDCQKVSKQISMSLDVTEPEPITGRYQLEVSSPGIERPLFTLDHYKKVIGKRLQIKLLPQSVARARRRYAGKLMAIEDENILLQTEEEDLPVKIAYVEIESAKLKADWNKI